MGIFSKKVKKTPEELKQEREAKISSTSNALRLQILTLEKKKEAMFSKVVEARSKGLKDQEAQARGLLKQIMASIKREQGMLMTLELAIETRDLAQLNTSFMETIGVLSEDILSAGKATNKKEAKRVGDRYLRAVYEANQQKERIDDMMSFGDYASVVTQDSNQYTEFDDEIDSMLDREMGQASFIGNTPTRNRY